ncbi:MAG: ABC transporter permease subunit [Candidatus Omnitrophica bacterium]|nr:ABC transporter permease subunit [Candidatus Omnitrophota bacterium]
MNRILAIAWKELSAYFKSPIAYIILVLTIAIFNVFFFMIIDADREASLKGVFQVMEFLFIFLVPILTMGLFAEERANGTLELLMTAPLTNTAIVLGKYLGALAFYTVIIALTLVYYGVIEFFGTPDRIAVLTGYAGIWLEGAFFLAVGMMASAWAGNQIVAAISSYAILFTLYFSIGIMQYFTGPAEAVVRQLSTWTHLENLATGLITAGDVVYYLSGILVCVAITRLSIENRAWR